MNMHVNLGAIDQLSPDHWAKDMNWQEWWTVEETDGTWRHPYKSPNLPEWYNTVIGRNFDYFPDGCGYYEDEKGNAMSDPTFIKIEEWCVEKAAEFGLAVHEVEAPDVLKAHGIMTLKAFPTILLDIPVFQDYPVVM